QALRFEEAARASLVLLGLSLALLVLVRLLEAKGRAWKSTTA
ncbi:molybdate ABC transporter permease subunit, partial [Thermus scotoductus]